MKWTAIRAFLSVSTRNCCVIHDFAGMENLRSSTPINLHMRRHLEEVFLPIRLNVLLGVDRKILVGIHRDQHLTDVRLQHEENTFVP
jgi:hypothetical protein